MGFFAAIRFLTILPAPFSGTGEGEEAGNQLSYFPLVGLVIGLLLVAIYRLLSLLLPGEVVLGLVIAASIIISGGLHLDGLADTCDGLAGYRATEDRLRIMRDSRVGAFAVIGVTLVILLKYLSLSTVPANMILVTIVLMPVLSRWAMVYAVTAFPYARPSGLGASFKQGASWARFGEATLIALAVTLLLTFWTGLAHFYLVTIAVMLGIWVVTLVMSIYLKSKFSGLTGDSYGAISEVAEVAVPLFILILVPTGWFVTAG
ncbi:MAG: adenosylcobinamide-GDP ribazoletransferase [Dehalococcoidales bacterium]|nr:adenosylcobinamide-GDP ribazoletransferase [Dehalococcoidales bacterium]